MSAPKQIDRLGGKDQNPLQGYDKIFKIILLGKADAGKTSLISKFVEDFYKEGPLTTIGVDLKCITLKGDDGTAVRLQIWDTAG